jgi:hypothetical protein
MVRSGLSSMLLNDGKSEAHQMWLLSFLNNHVTNVVMNVVTNVLTASE